MTHLLVYVTYTDISDDSYVGDAAKTEKTFCSQQKKKINTKMCLEIWLGVAVYDDDIYFVCQWSAMLTHEKVLRKHFHMYGV